MPTLEHASMMRERFCEEAAERARRIDDKVCVADRAHGPAQMGGTLCARCQLTEVYGVQSEEVAAFDQVRKERYDASDAQDA